MGIRWRQSALVCAALATWSCDDARSPPPAGVDAAVLDDRRPASGDDGAEGCVLDGYACGDAGECCSGVCSDGLCGLGGTCVLAGGACATPDECCTRQCTSSVCTGTANYPSPPTCINVDAACDGGTPCCSGGCTGGYCMTCQTLIGPGACNACIADACCPTVSQCSGDESCHAFLQCVVACEGDGGSGYACALGSCRPDADALTTGMVECYASSCTTACHGS